MATYIVTRVRKELSADGTHRHIEGACTETGDHYTRREVVDSIDKGNIWQTSADGYEAIISAVMYCLQAKCYATPYIATNPSSPKRDNLENLEEC